MLKVMWPISAINLNSTEYDLLSDTLGMFHDSRAEFRILQPVDLGTYLSTE